jgi:DNA repair protein RecN (Recombination protein N)
MLVELSIENFAIIDRLLLRFEPGFTVLTGETGAGKSIIIDALQASLGARTGSEVVRGAASHAVVEAVFDLRGDERDLLAPVMNEYGLEDDTVIMRREISSAGRSGARINGRAVPLSVLTALGALLVDIHGQSDHLSLLQRQRQLDVLDHYGSLIELRNRVRDAVREYGRLRRELEELVSGQRAAEQRLDLLRFQVEEIGGAALRAEEDHDLESERTRLANAERITQLSTDAHDALGGEAESALEAIDRATSAVRDLASIDPSMRALAERLDGVRYEVEDVAQEMRHYRDTVEYDPRRLEEVEARLDLLNRLERKYGSSLDAVIAFGEQARIEMEQVENLDQHIEDLRCAVEDLERQAGALAAELSSARREAADSMTAAMSEALQGLGLRGTSFEVDLTQSEDSSGLPVSGQSGRFSYSQSGIDSASFLVSFNPGEPMLPLEKVASGGETSRFLLALKSVLAGADRTPTLIFDEVDAGVGARSGSVVGERLRALAGRHQVISITHLPQVAALADHHVTVEKGMGKDQTTVNVRAVEGPERVLELAEMMSGTGSEAARRSAEELLQAAQRSA